MAEHRQSQPGDSSSRLPWEQDRSNCPSDDTLKALAHGQHLEDEELEAHLATCDYCRRELVDHKAQRELGRFYNKTSWLLTSVVILMIFVAIYRSCSAGQR
jgi:hypothetical protein